MLAEAESLRWQRVTVWRLMPGDAPSWTSASTGAQMTYAPRHVQTVRLLSFRRDLAISTLLKVITIMILMTFILTIVIAE